MNFETCLVLDFERHRKRRRSNEVRTRRTPRIVELLDLAEAMQLALDDGTVNNRTELARFHELSRARITQLLALLRLHPGIRAAIRRAANAGDPVPSERQLRPILGLPASEQLVATESLMSRGVVAPQGGSR